MITYPAKISPADIKITKIMELKGISKKYPGPQDFWALKDISLDVYRGEILGIIGRNGAGKTTLLNIMIGTLFSTRGEVYSKGKTLGLLNLGVGFQDELTGKENIFLNGAILGATQKELKDKINTIIDFSELGDFINMPLGTYSQGMRLRLGFSIIINLDFDILAIDEILAVGDALFQSKCFERLMAIKRSSKTLIITTQGMDLIERLCDKVALLDHGELLFYGETPEGVNRYRSLLNSEEFFVGPKKAVTWIQDTKKWADNISDWGKKFGTKEVAIDSVEFINRFGIRCNQIRSQDPLKIKVYFTARNNVKDPHFGVAIFRKDGVYCFGSNTKIDGHKIPELKRGKGYFMLEYYKVLLAPGEYRISIAIWDKDETLAFNYHNGCYRIIIKGDYGAGGGLLNMPFRFRPENYCRFKRDILELSVLSEKWGQRLETEGIRLESLRLLNHFNKEKSAFLTNEPAELKINFSELSNSGKKGYLWIGFYRDDGICCQRITRAFNRSKNFRIIFPKLPLLPGSYRISLGIFDGVENKFIMCHHGIYPIRMISIRADHGTVYLEHKWRWRLP